ncbi:hypothetical protein DFH09DRAFT_1328788 [Mycena vulgaris]|nr:hypothetical protein DFH09DRAFT_1328788 [Mycena vulgaris]
MSFSTTAASSAETCMSLAIACIPDHQSQFFESYRGTGRPPPPCPLYPPDPAARAVPRLPPLFVPTLFSALGGPSATRARRAFSAPEVERFASIAVAPERGTASSLVISFSFFRAAAELTSAPSPASPPLPPPQTRSSPPPPPLPSPPPNTNNTPPRSPRNCRSRPRLRPRQRRSSARPRAPSQRRRSPLVAPHSDIAAALVLKKAAVLQNHSLFVAANPIARLSDAVRRPRHSSTCLLTHTLWRTLASHARRVKSVRGASFRSGPAGSAGYENKQSWEVVGINVKEIGMQWNTDLASLQFSHSGVIRGSELWGY